MTPRAQQECRSKILSAHYQRTGFQYLDTRVVSEFCEISRAQARRELEHALAAGQLEKIFVYFSSDCPAPIEIGEDEIDTKITLGSAGFIENPDEEITLHKIHVSEVYSVPQTT